MKQESVPFRVAGPRSRKCLHFWEAASRASRRAAEGSPSELFLQRSGGLLLTLTLPVSSPPRTFCSRAQRERVCAQFSEEIVCEDSLRNKFYALASILSTDNDTSITLKEDNLSLLDETLLWLLFKAACQLKHQPH